jgi:cytochrome c oxidase assembly protein subunit 15
MTPAQPHKSFRNWLFFTAFMVFAMAIIGAITRLTESGLSMVEWKPLIGALPPLHQEEWERVFGLYKQTPEFIHKHSWMELEDFKKIFFWEWLHRLWGRAIGLVYALPLLWFWVRGKIPTGYKGKLLLVLLIGAAQGAMGWFMVVSGLSDVPEVSHYRLAAHLGLALFLMCALIWLALDFTNNRRGGTFCEKRHGWIAFALLSFTIAWGAFVAGKDGGLLYNTWPMMDAHWIPPEVMVSLYSFMHDPGALQFFHRWIAVLAVIAVGTFAYRMRDPWLTAMIFVQFGLGVTTILTQVWIPVATAHQGGSMIVLALMIMNLHKLHNAGSGKGKAMTDAGASDARPAYRYPRS